MGICLEVSSMNLDCISCTASLVKKTKKIHHIYVLALSPPRVIHHYFILQFNNCSINIERNILKGGKPVVHVPVCPEEGFMMKSLFSSPKACVREHVPSLLWWTSLQHQNWGDSTKKKKEK